MMEKNGWNFFLAGIAHRSQWSVVMHPLNDKLTFHSPITLNYWQLHDKLQGISHTHTHTDTVKIACKVAKWDDEGFSSGSNDFRLVDTLKGVKCSYNYFHPHHCSTQRTDQFVRKYSDICTATSLWQVESILSYQMMKVWL